MNSYGGEKIGTIIRNSQALDSGDWAKKRLELGRWIFNATLNAVLKGAGYNGKCLVKYENEEQAIYDVYTHPSITDPEEAQRLGLAVVNLLSTARRDFPAYENDGYGQLQPQEMDAFTQRYYLFKIKPHYKNNCHWK